MAKKDSKPKTSFSVNLNADASKMVAEGGKTKETLKALGIVCILIIGVAVAIFAASNYGLIALSLVMAGILIILRFLLL